MTRRAARTLFVAADEDQQRDRGVATVAALTLCFVFLTGALVWLSSTVDRSLNDRTDAAEIALQAARSGAQALDPIAIRNQSLPASTSAAAARAAATATAQRLLAANGETGAITSFDISGARVTVTVAITTTGRSVSATASATATAGRTGVGR